MNPGVTSTMLGSMKGIKMSGLTQKLSQLIGNLRVKEAKSAKKLRLLNVYGATLGMFFEY
jgi:ATP-binding cassette, subfamily C (CFTR/MRP), member 1